MEPIRIRFGISPCPNDTFLFYAITHQKIKTDPFIFEMEHHDIGTLNQLAREHVLDLTKVSLTQYAFLQQHYQLLSAGASFGKGVGPLVITSPHPPSDGTPWKIGLPGPFTTAHFLTTRWMPSAILVFLPFNQIFESLHSGEIDAGVIVHESRFTHQHHSFPFYCDLGQWWDQTFHLPLPLGGVILKKEWKSHAEAITKIIRDSLHYAQIFPQEPLESMLHYAHESSIAVLKQHVDLYVNEYTKDFGDAGRAAIALLLDESMSKSCSIQHH